MPKYACTCGYVMNLSQGWSDYELTLIPESTIEGEKGTDLFFYSKAGRGVRIRVSKINLSPFLFSFLYHGVTVK